METRDGSIDAHVFLVNNVVEMEKGCKVKPTTVNSCSRDGSVAIRIVCDFVTLSLERTHFRISIQLDLLHIVLSTQGSSPVMGASMSTSHVPSMVY